MTRPKSVRQAAKNTPRIFLNLPILRRVSAQLTPKYGLNRVLLDYGVMVYPFQISWHPQEPTVTEMLGLLGDEMAKLMEMVIKLDGDAT